MSIIDLWKRRAQAMPPPDGTLPDGTIDEVMGATTVIVLVDSRGRVFQIEGATVLGGHTRYIRDGRSELLRLLDTFGVEDWSEPPSTLAI